jgi:PKD repeat protein
MKRIYAFLLAVMPFAAMAQVPTKTISGNITSSYTFHNDTIYILDGFVFVKNNATLTVEPGTIVKGIKESRSTLIITMGAKIIADGTKSQPIVFTSNEATGNRAPGDWGGIIILGRNIINRQADCTTCPGVAVAATLDGNQNAIEGDIDNANGDGLYGGTLTNDNSGILRYVRVEFAGVVITPGNEINSITLGAVGSETILEYIQVTQGNDDAFEWFGGNVNAKYLIATGTVDDDFDSDFGYNGKVQFAIAQRDSFNFDTGNNPTTNSFESDNDGGPTFANPRTRPIFSNVTLVGPAANGPLEDQGSFQNGARIRRNSQLSLFNSIVIGYPTGILLDGTGSTNSYLGDTLLLKNNIVAGALGRNITTNQAASYDAVVSKFMTEGNDTSNTFAGILNDPFNYLNPNFLPASGSNAASGASFSGSEISDTFFTATTFRGAIDATNNWSECWSEFDPNNVVYNNTINFGPSASFTTNANELVVNTNNTSTVATTYSWNFGDGSPVSSEASPSHTYTADGTYTITLIANNNCGSDTVTSSVTVQQVGINDIFVNTTTLIPNPTNNVSLLNFNLKSSAQVSVDVLDISGRILESTKKGQLNAGENSVLINVAEYAAGTYFVRINADNNSKTIKLAVSK